MHPDHNHSKSLSPSKAKTGKLPEQINQGIVDEIRTNNNNNLSQDAADANY